MAGAARSDALAGLGYEYNTPPREQNQRIENTFNDPALARVPSLQRLLAGRTTIFAPDRNNFAPRVGLAYQPDWFGAQRPSVLRVGYGNFYDQVLGAVVSQSRNVFPTFVTLNFGGLRAFDSFGTLGSVNPANVFINRVPLLKANTTNQLNPELGAAIAPVEVFFNEYFYPELLSTVMGQLPLPARENISLRDRRQPELQLAVKNIEVTEASTRRVINVTIQAREAAPGSGARDVRLFRNGTLIQTWRGDVLQGQPAAVLSCSVVLVAGANHLSAYAFNRDNIKNADLTQLVTGAASLRRAGTAYVIAAGINQHSNADFNLNFAVADAELFCAEWQKRNYSRF